MDYISKIHERAQLQQLREFLLYGQPCAQTTDLSHKEQLARAWDTFCLLLETEISDPDQRARLRQAAIDYSSVHTSVYMEVGLQAGATLVRQLDPAQG